ncbi:hypothetical protein [Arthrobacter roseus]|uniref:hypothetical protein n=1 Tax=Arthrobacter roseus TaxID=136274 RepID=UPI001964BCBA|nr:hypothetical protein [Arthrobacter roseus]MBM7847504.1 hypothetical protein [Arthrobacter roseus]
MSEQERNNLLDLHRAAMTTWESAVIKEGSWDSAYAADDAFRDALMAVQVTP